LDLRYGRIEAAAFIVVVVLATAFESSGTPILRHDWPPPISSVSESFGPVTGWDQIGFGSAVGYPSSFLVVLARSAASQCFGSFGSHLIYMFSTWLLIGSGARSLSARCGAGLAARIAAIVIATFNPWTYTELVAGHLFTLLACGATFWLAAEAMRQQKPRSVVLPCLILAFAPQIQFLVLDGAALAIVALRAREVRPIALLAVFGVLIGATIEITKSTLAGIALILEWERGNSIAPFDATLLRGYFTHYSQGGDAIASIAIVATIVLAAAGLAFGRKTLATIVIAAMTFCAVVFSTGLKGPLSLQFAWAVGHVPEIGLFRELYTLLGFALVGYVALASYAAARFPVAGVVWLVAAAAAPASWFASPPAAWWAVARDLPAITVPTAANERYALLPAFGPLSFGNTGSGLDPNLVAAAGSSNPINEYAPKYPVDAAFGRYLEYGDPRSLEALSVFAVIDRPWLKDRWATDGALPFPLPDWLVAARAHETKHLRGTPLLTLSPLPAFGTMLVNVGGGNVQLGDGMALCPLAGGIACWSAPVPVRAPNTWVKASDGWVDARLAFIEAPELAQSYGGALTTDSEATLPLRTAEDALVWVSGRLTDGSGRRVLLQATGGYRWIAIPPDVDSVRCFGRCIVAAEAPPVPRGLPLEPAPKPVTAVPMRTVLPWLVVARVAAGDRGTLRYNVRYDEYWRSYIGWRQMPHLRLDAVANGWILPKRNGPERVILIELGAFFTALLEVCVVLAFVAALLPDARRLLARRKGRRLRIPRLS
jgi:hypothetical protein